MKMSHLIRSHVKELNLYLVLAYIWLSFCCFLPFSHDHVSSFHANGKLTEQNNKIVASINKIFYCNTHEYCMVCSWQVTSGLTIYIQNPLSLDLDSHKLLLMPDCNLMQSIYLSNYLSRDPPHIV